MVNLDRSRSLQIASASPRFPRARRGEVKFFNTQKGYGFILADSGAFEPTPPPGARGVARSEPSCRDSRFAIPLLSTLRFERGEKTSQAHTSFGRAPAYAQTV